MTSWRRTLLAATTLLVAFVATPSVAQAAPKPTTTTTRLAPGQTAPTQPGQVVESWALSPAGSLDPNQPGNRPFISYSLDPGATVHDAVNVFNYSNIPLTLHLYATDAFNNVDGSFDILAGDKKPKDAGTWITLDTNALTLQPGTQAQVPITVHVPAGVTPGDHAAGVLASSQALGTGPDGKVVNVDRRTGTRAYIRVSGPLHPDLAIEDIHTSYTPSLNPFSGTAKVSYRIQNRGNVRLAGTHQLSISGVFGIGKQSDKAVKLQELLPGQGLTVHATFHDVPAALLEHAHVTLTPAADTTGGAPRLPVRHRTGTGLAPPLTILLLAIAVWLSLRARRAYRRHREEPTPPNGPAQVRERQPA